FIFFFQAEDGIRDKLVTGVQTCALPILDPSWDRRGNAPRSRAIPLGNRSSARQRDRDRDSFPRVEDRPVAKWLGQLHGRRAEGRSEERRVGKECRRSGGGYK